MTQATAKYIHTAPRKIRLMLDGIRGMTAETALARLSLTPKQTAHDVAAVLRSALANAKDQGLSQTNLIVSKAYCDEGPSLKRRVMISRGRARPIEKKMSHIHIVLDTPRSTIPSGDTKQTKE